MGLTTITSLWLNVFHKGLTAITGLSLNVVCKYFCKYFHCNLSLLKLAFNDSFTFVSFVETFKSQLLLTL